MASLRVVLDVNVLVSSQNACRAGKIETISQRAVEHVLYGFYRGSPIQIITSLRHDR